MPVDIKRALKDKAYLDSLSKDELKEIIEVVAGSQTLGDADLDQIAGGLRKEGGCAEKTSVRSTQISC
jgi:hypothetical protein